MTRLEAAEFIACWTDGTWTPNEVLDSATKRQSAFVWAIKRASGDQVRIQLMTAMHLLVQPVDASPSLEPTP